MINSGNTTRESELKMTERHFQEVLDALPELAALMAPDGSVNFYNKAWYEFTGATEEQLSGWGWESLHDPDALAGIKEQWVFSLETKTNFEMAFRLRGKDGKFRTFLNRVIPMRDADGTLIRWLGIATDIQQELDARAAHEAQLTSILESMPVATWTTDPEGNVDYVNRLWLDVAGARLDEVLGSGWLDFLHPDDRASVRQTWLECLKHDEPYEVKFRIGNSEKHYRWFLTRGKKVIAPDGTVSGTVGGCTDIDETVNSMRCLKAINLVFEQALICKTDEQLGDACLAIAQWLTDSPVGLIGEINESGQHDTFALSSGIGDVLNGCKIPGGKVRPFFKNSPLRGIDRWVEKEGKPRIINGEEAIKSHPDYVGFPEGHPPITAFLGVPLKEAGETIGMIAVANKPGGYDTCDLENLERLSTAVVQCVKRKRAESESAAARCLKVINKVFEEALDCETLKDLGLVCIKAAQSLTKSEFGFFADRSVEIEGESRIVNGEDAIKALPDYVGFPPGHARITAFLGVPLNEGGKTIGMIGLANKPGGYTTADQENIELLASAVVQCINRKQAEIERRNAAKCLEAINRVFEVALTCNTIEELGVSCLGVAEWLTGSEFGYIGELTSEGLVNSFALSPAVFKAMEGYQAQPEQARASIGGLPLRGVDRTIFKDGKSRIVNGEDAIRNHPDAVGLPQGHAKLSAYLGVPLREGGIVIGSINLANKPGGYLPSDQENVERLSVAVVQALNRKKSEIERKVTDEKARDIAIEASNLKTAFLANISHELRTPLAGILGMNELLLQHNLSDQQRDCANAVEFSARNMLNLVNDLLDITKIEAGKMVLESVPFDPCDLVDKALAVVDQTARNKNLSLTRAMASDIPWPLLGDFRRLHQVLLNLLSNAVKFTQRGEVILTTSVEAADDDRIYLNFSVSDTGIGICEEDKVLLFRPFSQVDGSASRRFGGVGLGLIISRRLVELMGGTIGFDSQKGKGSRFWFTVPLKKVAARVPSHVAPAATQTDNKQCALRGKVLVVEDNSIVQKLVAAQMKSLGLCCKIVGTGEECLAELDRDNYSTILMDCHLPGMNGFEATNAIRKRESAKGGHIPIIAMTAAAMKGDQEKCLAAGMNDYVSKPYSIEQMREKLHTWLGKSDL